MANPVTDAGMPTSPLVDTTGNIQPAWRALLVSLFARTGGPIGKVTPDAAAIARTQAAETTARTAADAALEAQIASATATLAPQANPVLSGRITLNGVSIGAGPGVPTYAAASGSLHARSDGAVGARLYVCQGGASWLAVAGV